LDADALPFVFELPGAFRSAPSDDLFQLEGSLPSLKPLFALQLPCLLGRPVQVAFDSVPFSVPPAFFDPQPSAVPSPSCSLLFRLSFLAGWLVRAGRFQVCQAALVGSFWPLESEAWREEVL